MENLTSIESEFYGLVLAGGHSTRMGTDKALIEYHGIPQIEFVYHLLSNHCERVFISSKQHDDYLGYPIIQDAFDFDSPLNGILSALVQHPGKTWLVLACDMPFADTANIEHLISHRDTSKVAACYLNDEDIVEPLFSLWESTAAQPLLDFQKSGKISPKEFLRSNDVELITTLDPIALINVNTKEEYARYDNS